jgi:hypothetical protein
MGVSDDIRQMSDPNVLAGRDGDDVGRRHVLAHVLVAGQHPGDAAEVDAFGVPHQLDTGFEATSALKQGFLAKDGQTILEAMSTLYPLISGNEAKPLLVIGPVSLSSYQKVLSGVPTLESEMSSAALSVSKQAAVKEALALSNLSDDFAAPAGLPASELATLRQAFSQAASLPALKAQAVRESLPLSFIGGAAVSGQVNTALANSSSIAAYVNQ